MSFSICDIWSHLDKFGTSALSSVFFSIHQKRGVGSSSGFGVGCYSRSTGQQSHMRPLIGLPIITLYGSQESQGIAWFQRVNVSACFALWVFFNH
jgi:hypothetical protein